MDRNTPNCSFSFESPSHQSWDGLLCFIPKDQWINTKAPKSNSDEPTIYICLQSWKSTFNAIIQDWKNYNKNMINMQNIFLQRKQLMLKELLLSHVLPQPPTCSVSKFHYFTIHNSWTNCTNVVVDEDLKLHYAKFNI